ncbi:unnamed protein product [Arabidopsis halleri]
MQSNIIWHVFLAFSSIPNPNGFDTQSGGNFFKSTSYTIEALCAKTYEGTIEKLKEIEAKVLTKRFDLRQFETEYQQLEIEYCKALARFEKGTKRYSQEMQNVDELLKQRDSIR